MKQYYFKEKTGIRYTLQGDYYLPDLALPTEKETKPIGIWEQRCKRYLKEHRKVTYTTLLTSGKLNGYLADINEQAQGITKQLKAENVLEWVRRLNNIQACNGNCK